jgi:hypothetical protein
MAGRKPPRLLAPPQRPTVPRPRDEQPTVPVVPPAEPVMAPAPPPRPPVETAEEPFDGRSRFVVVTVVVLGLLVVVAVAVFLLRSPDPVSAPDKARAPDRVPAAPVDLAPQTSYVDVRIRPSGVVRVRHWIRSDAGVSRLGLSVPLNIRAVAGSPPVRVRNVLVVADGRAVSRGEWLRNGRGSYNFAGSTEVFVRYVLDGAVERSGSAPGRALARLIALEVDLSPPLRATTYAVSGGEVLDLACSARSVGAVPYPCGSPAGAGWKVRLAQADRHAVVSAQLDLP